MNLISFIQSVGYLGVFAVVYAESGLLIGMFLPGDSLLFTAGFLASQNHLNIALLCFLTFVGAVLGDSTGYWLGRRFGPTVFSRKDSLFFDVRHIERAQTFYAKHGSKTIILARFVPFIRTLAPTLAGVGNMPYATFFSYNVIGGILWGIGIPLSGYWLGSVIPGVDRYLIPIVALIIFTSVLPSLIHVARDPEYRAQLLSIFRRVIRRP